MKASFIMPVKNVEPFIKDAVEGVLSQPFDDWELIIVDDSSTDKTYSILESYAKRDKRIKPVRNPYKGKVMGLNHGYSLSKGDYIKCIDGDDVLMPDFGNELEKMAKHDAAYHDFDINDKNLARISSAKMGSGMKTVDFDVCFSEMMSIPRCLWSFKRSVADKIFPMPEELPFEDVWFSLAIKKYAVDIFYVNRSMYKYRQHENQTFGGYLNFSKDKVLFRARRMLKLFEVIEANKDKFADDAAVRIYSIKEFYNLLADERLSYARILFSGLDLKKKAKLVLMRKINRVAAPALRIKNVVGR